MTKGKIYSLVSRSDLEDARKAGIYGGSAADLRDGFIHFSTGDRVVESCRRHKAGVDDLIMLQVDAESLGPALKWERSRSGALFPHLYAALSLEAIERIFDLPQDSSGIHIFPDPFR